MSSKRKIEIFSADCPACHDTVNLVKEISCSSCEVTVLNMNEIRVSERARTLGIHRVPAVVIDGKLADCCSVSAPNEQDLRAAGIGSAL